MGEMLGGILLGPSLLGWVAPGLSAVLFPPRHCRLAVLSRYGIVFFMFLVGLETRPALLRGRERTALAIAGEHAPLRSGCRSPPGSSRCTPGCVRFAPFALFMGAAMSSRRSGAGRAS
jgi:hypothetical protein